MTAFAMLVYSVIEGIAVTSFVIMAYTLVHSLWALRPGQQDDVPPPRAIPEGPTGRDNRGRTVRGDTNADTGHDNGRGRSRSRGRGAVGTAGRGRRVRRGRGAVGTAGRGQEGGGQ